MKNRNQAGNDKKRSVSVNKAAKENRGGTNNVNNQMEMDIQGVNNNAVKEFQKGTDFINSLIHEYLLKKDYMKTLDMYQEEVTSKIRSKQYYSTKFAEALNESVLDSFFNAGKKNEFFKLWNRIIPSHLRVRDIVLEKLEFFLQIYFAVYPLLADKKSVKESALKETKVRMQEFKMYLESKEVEMSKTTEYLAYYALPYIQNPREHPSYKQIFTQEWVKELKEKLKTCLVSYVPGGKYPLLYDMYVTCDAGADGKVAKSKPLYNFLENYNRNFEMSVNENKNNSLLNNMSHEMENISKLSHNVTDQKLVEDYQKLKKKEEAAKITLIESQKKWTNFSLDLLTISFDLISNIRKLKNGAEVPYEQVESVNNKLIKYELFLKKNAEDLEKNASFAKDNNPQDNSILAPENKSQLQNQQIILNTSKNKSNNQSMVGDNSQFKSQEINQSIHINYDPNYLLDMQLVKSDCAKVNAFGYDSKEFYEKIILILREIRLRLTRRKYAKLKQLTLSSVIFYDLLGLRSKHVKIFSSLFANSNTLLETLKLMNALTNENRGRTYMLSKPSLLEDIVKIMVTEDADTEIRQNCLGIIQKFTLRSEPQKKLIELDVINWITNVFIVESGDLSDYTLEYGLALLMNLSLRSCGRDKCEKVSEKLLKVMISYMKSESIQVRTCINGTLYSLLKRKKIKTEARTLRLEKMLNAQLANPNEQMKKQIQYILDELNSNVEQEEKNDEEFEDENYGDEEENYEDDYVS